MKKLSPEILVTEEAVRKFVLETVEQQWEVKCNCDNGKLGHPEWIAWHKRYAEGLQNGLNPRASIDYAGLDPQVPETIVCSNCGGTGTRLTEMGKLLIGLVRRHFKPTAAD